MKLTMNWLLAVLFGALRPSLAVVQINDSNNSSSFSDVSDATDASDASDPSNQAQPTSAITTGSAMLMRATFEAEFDFAGVEDSRATFNLTIFSRWNFMAETLAGHRSR